MPWHIIILVLSLVSFTASAFNLVSGRINLIALGLALFILSLFI